MFTGLVLDRILQRFSALFVCACNWRIITAIGFETVRITREEIFRAMPDMAFFASLVFFLTKFVPRIIGSLLYCTAESLFALCEG